MLSITGRQGFHLTFANGYTISVQFGKGNYCGNRDSGVYGDDVEPSPTAEIAAWYSDDRDYVRFPDATDDVLGWQNADEVAAAIAYVAALPKPE